MGNPDFRKLDGTDKDFDADKEHTERSLIRKDDSDHDQASTKLFADQTGTHDKAITTVPMLDERSVRSYGKAAKPDDKAAMPEDKNARPDDKAGKTDLNATKHDDIAAKRDDKAAKPDDKKEIIELSKLPAEKRQEIESIRELQGYIIRFADQLNLGSEAEKKQFLTKLFNELGEGVEGDKSKFTKLPEFGETTKEGFKRLHQFLEKRALPDYVFALDKQLLKLPPGFPLKIAGSHEAIFKSSEALKQELAQNKGYLDVDPTKLADVSKLGRVTDWMNLAEKSLHDEHIVRLEKYLSKKVEDGIDKGIYPKGWRRPEGMDAETWCSAVEQTMNAYTRTTRVIEAINHLQKSGTGFNSEALDEKNLPPGIKLSRNESGKITNVDFGNLMVPDLALASDANRQKLDPLNAWCDKYEVDAQKGLAEALKALQNRNQVPGFGEAEVKEAYVNPKTKEFVIGAKESPGPGWQPFNLLGYDMSIKEERDAYGQTSKVFVSADVGFKQVPWYGYLNMGGQDVYREKSEKPVEYKPDDYVALQTGPGQIEMIQAKELSDWKARQELKYYGEKGIIATMDGAMIVSGVGELRVAAKVARLGVGEAAAIGGRVLKTEVAGELPQALVSSMVRKGVFDIGLGATGIFHNAGAKQIPWMNTVSDLRTAYFLGHAGYSVLSLARVPQGAHILGELAAPDTVARIDSAITSIRGSEAAIRNGELARSGALSKLPFWKNLEERTHDVFNLSEKAFVGMFLWDAVGMAQQISGPYRPQALAGASKALNDAALTDRSALEKIIEAGNKPSEKTETYMRLYVDTLELKDSSKKDCQEIIARMKELSKPGVRDEDKQKYMQELMKYFRYDGNKIHDLQNGRLHENLLSEAKLRELANKDRDYFDANIRKMAAMAILALSRKADGTWTETVTSRSQTVPKFTEFIQGGNTVISAEVPEKPIEQKLSPQELIEFLQADMRETSDPKARTEKARALHENGLVSGEQLGDLLLSRIEGKQQGVSKEERLAAISDLAGLLSRLKIEEEMRDGSYNRNEKYAATGLTVGLTSADLLRRLEKIATDNDDKDIEATAGLCLTLLRKENLDDVDKQRICEFFLKDPPGISEAAFKEKLETDAASLPTDKSSWERKLIACQFLLRQSISHDAAKIDMQAVAHLRECLKATDQPEFAVRAFETLTGASSPAVSPASPASPESAAVSPLQTLEAREPDKHWRNQILTEAMGLLNLPVGNLSIAQQLEAARARLKLIDTITPLAKESEGSEARFLKRQLLANLLSRADRSSEPVAEVRAEAVKAIGELGIRENEQIDLLKKAVDQRTEPSAAVRLAAIDAIERLVARNKERKEILSPLAVLEPDPAVRDRLSKYYVAAGKINDRGSQAALQDVADARTGHSQEEFKPADVADMVKERSPALCKSRSIFDYIDADREACKILPLMQPADQTLGSLWDADKGEIDSFLVWDKHYAQENMIRHEVTAQNRAVAAYNRGIDNLSEKAMTGSSDKTVQLGDKRLSEKDAALLSLGYLLRSGSQMGEAFYLHRNTNDRHEPKPDLRAFSAAENDLRSGTLQTIYHSEKDEPWHETEQRIAKKMSDLCSQSSDTVDLFLLKDQMLLGLASEAKTSDASRKILADGLDELLSNPHTSAESRREIIQKVSLLVRNSREVDKDKSESMVALIGLLDKHGKAVYEKDSLEYSVIRNDIDARSPTESRHGLPESLHTPPQVRLRAEEMFDRQWQSVLAEYDRIPAQQGTARARADSLPKNYEALLKSKDGKVVDGHDEDVQDAVQGIIMATKGLPLTAADPRRQTLLDLTDKKYDDRVRMAAALAISESKSDAPNAQRQLLDIAVNSSDRAIRQDATKVLMRTDCSSALAAEGELNGLRSQVVDKLAAALHKTREELVDKSVVLIRQDKAEQKHSARSDSEIIKMAADFVADTLAKSAKDPGSVDARLVARAKDLQESLHRYSEGLALIGNLKLAGSDKSSREQAENLLKMSLNAFGVSDADIDSLARAAKPNYHRPGNDETAVRAIADRLIQSAQLSGNIPGLLSALNGYGKLCSSQIAYGNDISANLDRSLGVLNLSETIAKTYYPEGSQGRVDEYRTLAGIFQQIGYSERSEPVLCYNQALKCLDKARAELEAYRQNADLQMTATKEGLNQAIDKQLTALQNDHLRANLERFASEIKDNYYSKGSLKEQSDQMEKELSAIKDKSKAAFAAERFVKDWFDIQIAPDGQEAAAQAKAETSLDAALKLFAAEFGTASPQYERMLKMMWNYHIDQDQPKKAEAFFNDGLEKSKDPGQLALHLLLLKHYCNFLKSQKRYMDAGNVQDEYHRLTGTMAPLEKADLWSEAETMLH